MFPLVIPLAIFVLFMAAAGQAAISAMTAKAHVGWLGQITKILLLGPTLLAQITGLLAKHIASWLWPAYAASAKHLSAWFAALGQTYSWSTFHGYRNSHAIHNVAAWADNKLRSEITRTATVSAEVAALEKAGRLTPLGARQRYQAKAVEAATIRSIEGDILKKIAHNETWQSAIAADLPLAKPLPGVKGGYTKAQLDVKIKQYIRAALVAGGLAIPFPFPGKVSPVPKAQPKINHNVNARLRRIEKILGITGLAGLVTATFGREITRFLRCPNTRGIAKAWCGANLASLLALIAGAVVIEEGIGLEDFANAMLKIEGPVVNGILAGISEFEGVTL